MATQLRTFSTVGYHGAPFQVSPGNTLSSLSHALGHGADAIFISVRLTSDDVVVLYYDAMRKIEERDVPIVQRSYSEWQRLMAEQGEELTTLDEAMGLARSHDAGIILDVRGAKMENLLARTLRRSGFPLQSLLVAIQDPASRSIMRGLDPRIPLAHWLDAGAKVDAKLLADVSEEAVLWNYRILNPAFVKILRMRSIAVYAWIVDQAEDMRRMRDECEVDGIVTRSAELLSKLAPKAAGSQK